MGIFNALLGYPNIDPTGTSRELFEKVGKQAMTMFFRGQVEGALQHVQRLQEMVSSQYGPHHPDVGRATLLGAIMLTTLGQYEDALEVCELALETFEAHEGYHKHGVSHKVVFDMEAAMFLKGGLENLSGGEHATKGDGYLISATTPVGAWLSRLKS
jgi:hypothetical protein